MLSSDSPLHFTHHIRSEGSKSVPGPTSPLYIPVALILGGLPRVCPSSSSPLSSTSKPPLIHHIHTHMHTLTHTTTTTTPSSILPQLRGILQLWTMFHFFTGHIFDSLMAPAKRRTCTERQGASPIFKSFKLSFNIMCGLACHNDTMWNSMFCLWKEYVHSLSIKKCYSANLDGCTLYKDSIQEAGSSEHCPAESEKHFTQ